MWSKLKEQLPAVFLTIVLIGGVAYWLHQRTVTEMATQQEAQLAELRAETTAELRASTEDTRRQIDAVNTLLKDAINSRSSEMFMTDDELATLNQQRVNELAVAIAHEIQPYNPLPRTPEEAAEQETTRITAVSSSITERIEPLLAKLSVDQNLTRETLENISAEISDQLSVVLTSELAKNEELNQKLAESQALSQESLALSHELAALYLSSFEDKGVLTRILTLPAGVLKDVSKGSIVNSTERRQKEEELLQRMGEIQDRINALNSSSPLTD